MKHQNIRAATLLGVLGVVYGDIGTSPLYALKASLAYFHGQVLETEVLGLLSLILWSLILIVTLKYVVLVMRADNKGEGGILALTALAQRASSGRLHASLGFIGIIGACLFFGDGLITPAISVLSAVEGLEVSLPEAGPAVLPISVIIIIALFAMQTRGTSSIGKIFGPVMIVWFGTIGILGGLSILQHPSVLWALSPHYGIAFCWTHDWLAFIVLGAVVLSVTGAEALYADMGHFGARPIRVVWLSFVLPTLVLNYFGQGALILNDPSSINNPFFQLGPIWLQLPLVGLATLATVIASQALITGAFSMARQCMQLGILPRLTVKHTSEDEEGQIFLPQINIFLAIGVLFLVLTFRTSDALASAYGIAVTGTFLCTCIAAGVVFRRLYGWSRWMTFTVFGGFFAIDAVFFAANALKIAEGGYVPLVLAGALIVVMTTWRRGRALMLDRIKHDSLSISSFLDRLPNSSIQRVPGLAVFMTSNPTAVPSALLHNLKHNKVLHEKVIFVTVENADTPHVYSDRRAEVTQLIPNIYRVNLRFGFMDTPNIPRSLKELSDRIGFDPGGASFFLGRTLLMASKVSHMQRWRLRLFFTMARNAVSTTEAYYIPHDRVVELGVRIAI